MGSVNRVILVGNLGRDAEVKYTKGGDPVSNFSIATSETWKDKNGQKQERVEWHSVDLWGKQAESLGEFLVRGKQIYVEGRLQTDEYTDKEGIKRKSTKVRCDKLVLLGGGGNGSSGGGRRPMATDGGGAIGPDETGSETLTDDDIPF